MESLIEIDNRKIGEDFPPYVVAEMSANHNGSIENACKIISMAKASGADAVKLQTYHPDKLTMDINRPEFMIKSGPWGGQSLYQLYEKAFMPWEWHKPLFDHAKQEGITIFSSPFDNTAVDLLEDLNTPAYKIASFEAVDLPLVEYVAQTGKPMIVSTGLANLEEIQEVVEVARGNGCKSLALLYCVSGYPAPAKDYNLRTLHDMKNRFDDLVVGLSDHTIENVTSIASVAMGASIIEKHVTLDQSGGGPDDHFSLDPSGLRRLCGDVRVAWDSIGSVDYGLKSSERGNIQFRRSLYFSCDMKSGQVVTEESVRSIRPGYGLPPKYLKAIIGKPVLKNVRKGDRVQMDMFSKVAY